MHVYTPPGYEGGDAKYPVFYLLHGGGDEDSGWSTIGRAGFILDNLIAAKKAVPMIVVMPNGSLPPPKDMPARPAPGEAPSAEFRAAMEKMQNRFTDELLKEVVPAVEKTYRVKTGRENRALAGLSMGGGQTLRVLVTHPEEFAYVGIWMPASSAATPSSGRSRTRTSSPRRTSPTARSSGWRSSSATRTSRCPARRPSPRSSRSTGSSTTCGSPAAATPGSTGGTISTSSRRSCSGNATMPEVASSGCWQIAGVMTDLGGNA